MSVRTLVKSIQNIMRKDTGVDGDAQRISQLCWMFFLKIIDDQDQELELMQAGYASPIPERFQWRAWAADPEGITGETLLAFVDDELFPTLKNLTPSGQSGDRRRVVRDVFEDAYNYMKSGQLMRQVVNKIGTDQNLGIHLYTCERWRPEARGARGWGVQRGEGAAAPAGYASAGEGG